MGNVLKGTVWFATIVLATIGALTFVPDTAWESFPSSLASTRSTLARIGVAPVKYARATVEPGVAEPMAPNAGASIPSDHDYARANSNAPEFESAPRVRIGAGRSTPSAQDEREESTTDESAMEPYATETRSDGFPQNEFSQNVAPDPTSAAENATPASPPAFDPREFMPEREREETPSDASVDPAALQNSAFDDFPAGTDASFFGDSVALPPPSSPTTASNHDPADQFQGVSTPAPTNPAFASPAPEKEPDSTLQSLNNVREEVSRQVVDDLKLKSLDDEIPPMPQVHQDAANPAANPVAQNPPVANPPAQNPPTASPQFADPNAPLDASNALLDNSAANNVANTNATNNAANNAAAQSPSSSAADLNCAPAAPNRSTPQVSVATAPNAAPTPAPIPAPNAAASELAQLDARLEATLTSAQRIESADQARDVFLSLNDLRRAYVRLGVEDRVARANSALDQLAYEVFYNPQRAILEPMYVIRQGDTIASIARQYQVAPETLAAINGLAQDVKAPLPPGANLKVVRGPVKAEMSESKKELLLSFNDLYAGRFKFGTPQQATNLRGEYVVESKIDNPVCDAIDTTGAKITIPGGSSENPLGACWIGLQGGYGLQGTNRPELIGTVVPENGGFIFSNREISQLSVLLPVGASVIFND